MEINGLGVTKGEERNYAIALIKRLIREEIAAREAADSSLTGSLTAEESARESADRGLGERIDAEESAREAADTELGKKIDAEKSAREAADRELSERIDVEESARKITDSNLSGVIGEKGDLQELTTGDKSSLVHAINWLNSVLGDVENNCVGNNNTISDRVTALEDDVVSLKKENVSNSGMIGYLDNAFIELSERVGKIETALDGILSAQ